MAKLIPVDGPDTKVSPKKGKTWSIEELQAHVGGDIEILTLAANLFMVFHEDARRLKLPQNDRASLIAQMQVLGPALVISKPEKID